MELRNAWSRSWLTCGELNQAPKKGRFERFLKAVALLGEPQRILHRFRGIEDFSYPGSGHLLDLPPHRPDILHFHNLHYDYFDLSLLPELSTKAPTVLTLHDQWAFTGHCGYSLDCNRWEKGCGNCPYLDIYPPIRRDATAFNLERKREIFSRCQLHVVSPSRWLLSLAERSILAGGIIQSECIPNGIDTEIFHPTDQSAARDRLALPARARVLLFVGNRVLNNDYKDFDTMHRAYESVSSVLPHEEVIFVCLGEDSDVPPARAPRGVQFRPIERDSQRVADYYRACDIYVHAAVSDNFPLTILEAMACGVPVVATATGGIPEQVEDGRSGFLVGLRDHKGMANRIVELLKDPEKRRRLGEEASRIARSRYRTDIMASAYLDWYKEVLANSDG